MGEGTADRHWETDVAESISHIHLGGVEIGRVLRGLESKLAELRESPRPGGTTSNL